jgi:hypothetical protein
MQAATLSGDIPFMVAGAALASPGGPITATGGAFALPTGLRQVLMDKYGKGEVQSFSDFWSRLGDATTETIKGFAVGAATGAAGKFAPTGLAIPAEVSAMTTVGSALEGRVPEPKDFIDAAILIGGLRGSRAVASKLRTIYAKTGRHPKDIAQDTTVDASVMQDVVSSNRDVPEIYSKYGKVATKFGRRPLEPGEITEGEPVKRSEISKFIQEKFDVPIRQGRFRAKETVRGIFKWKPEVIRERLSGDLETEFHELGHRLHKKFWKKLSDKPFEQFRDELEPIASEAKTPDLVLTEGFAEFVRMYISWPEKAKTVAPKTYRAFEKILKEQAPQEYENLMHTRELFDKWIKQSPEAHIDAQIHKDSRSMWNKIREKVNFKEFYTHLVDDFYPLKRIVKQMSKGVDLPTATDPYKQARLFRGVYGKAEHFLEYSPFTFLTKQNIGKSLKSILRPAGKDLKAVSRYAMAKRTIEKSRQGIETGIHPEIAKIIVKKYGAKYEKIFQELQTYQDHLLVYMRDSGLIGQNAYKIMKALNKDYVPFYRAFEPRKMVQLKRGFEPQKAVKRMFGGSGEIYDPIESIIKNTYFFIQLAEKNAIGKSLVALANKRQGMGKYVEKIPQSLTKTHISPEEITRWFKKSGLEELIIEEARAIGDKGRPLYADIIKELPDFDIFRTAAFQPKDNVISVWLNGKRQLFQVDPDIARVLQALDQQQVNFLLKLVGVPAKWLRAGAILSPDFIARNPVRDAFSAFSFSKYGFVPGTHFVKGIFELSKLKKTGKSKYYQEWLKGGGAHSMLVSLDRRYLQKRKGDLVRKYPVFNKLKNPIEALRVLSELSEAATRVGEFKMARKAGRTIEESAFEAREVTLDFAKKGATGKVLNQLIAFWNANVQGTDRVIQAFRERPIQTTARVTAGITMPSILLYLINKDDPRYQDLPRWQKDLFWIILTDDHIYRIPKPFELGILFGTVPERIVEFILTKDPKAFDGVVEAVGRGAAPGIVPTTFVPPIENYANQNMFLDRPLIPKDREGWLPEYQYRPYTSEISKTLGKLIGYAPVKIENTIQGWSGGLGMYAVKLLEQSFIAAGVYPEKNLPTKTLADIPVIRAFVVRYPSASTEHIAKFYENYNDANEKYKTFRGLISKEYNFEEASRVLEKYKVEMLRNELVRTALINSHKAIRLIYAHPTMDPDEKRQMIDRIYLQMSEMAKVGNDALEKIKKELKEENRSKK